MQEFLVESNENLDRLDSEPADFWDLQNFDPPSSLSDCPGNLSPRGIAPVSGGTCSVTAPVTGRQMGPAK